MRDSIWFGGRPSHECKVWPPQNFFKGKKRSDLQDFKLARLDWGVGTCVESLKFTMSNGESSPKFGNRAFTHTCSFADPITKVMALISERRIAGLVFYTEDCDEYLRIETPSVSGNSS